MQAKKKSIVFLPLAFCFLFIFLVTPCAGLDDKKAESKINTYKIESVQPSQDKPRPEAGATSDAKTDPAAQPPDKATTLPAKRLPPQSSPKKVDASGLLPDGASGSASQKMPALRTKRPETGQGASDTDVSPARESADMYLKLILIAIIIVVFILILLIFKNRRKKSAATALNESDTRSQPGILPESKAELIDVAHVIPQGSVSLAIDKASVSIGRDPHNDIVIPANIVSNRHATITCKGGQYYLEDNRSTNGTRLNNVRIQQDTKVKLKSGDIIHFARCEFRFLVYDQAPYGENMLIDMD